MSLLQGKNALVMGVVSERSIAWGVALALSRNGAKVHLTYQRADHEDRIRPLAEQIGATTSVCDVELDSELERLTNDIGQTYGPTGSLDVIVHSLAFAPREALTGRYYEATTREAFAKAHDVSAYSLVAVTRALKAQLTGEASIVAMTHLASQRPLPGYNVMANAKASLESVVRSLALDLGQDGIRANAISPGPIRTLAASAVKGLRELITRTAEAAPLRRPVTIEDVGNTAVYLASDLSRNVTGQIIYVDGGFHIVGFPGA